MSMKRILAVGAMLLITTGVWAQAAAEGHGKKAAAAGGEKKMAAKAGGVEAALFDIENKWTEAGKKQDPKVLEPYLAPEFTALGVDGKFTNRADYLAAIGKAKWETSELSNLKAHVSGNHALVTGTWRGKGTDASGKHVDTTENWLDSFVMTGGKWLCTSDASATAK
jgi:ketosteroid isomerase-like protein